MLNQKKEHLHDQGREPSNQEDQGLSGYIQNSEQNPNSLWNKIRHKEQ